MCFLRIRPEHAPMNPPGAAPTLTNIYNEDKYFAPPSYASPSNPNVASSRPTQARESSKTPSTAPQVQQQPRHNYPRYHHHEGRRAAGDQPLTTSNPPVPKTKRKHHDNRNPAPATENSALTELNPAATSIPTTVCGAPNPTTITTDHSAPPLHEGSTRIEQDTHTKTSESLDDVGGGLVHEYGGRGRPSSALGGGKEDGGDERQQRVDSMMKQVEGLEREVRGIGRAL